jgi:hypothetical protein
MGEIRSNTELAREKRDGIVTAANPLTGISSITIEGGNVPAIVAAQAVHDRLIEMVARTGYAAIRNADKIIGVADYIRDSELRLAQSIESKQGSM